MTDPARARFDAGDPLRAVAALSVFVHHAALWGLFVAGVGLSASATGAAYGEVGGKLLAALDAGLYLFFVLSGYLISRPFVSAFIRGERRPAMRPYVRRRLLRIVPAFWFVVVLILIRHGGLDASVAEIVAIFGFFQTYVHGGAEVEWAIGQAWTLHNEMVFYLLVPVVAWAIAALAGRARSPELRGAVVIGAAAAVALASLALRHYPPTTMESLRGFPEVAFAFTPGVALAALETLVAGRLLGATWPRQVARLLAVCAAGLFVVYAWRRDTGSFAVSGAFATAAPATLIAACLLWQWSGGRPARALDNGPMRWLGERSYSIYLIHEVLLWELATKLDRLDHPATIMLALVPLGLVATLPLAAFTYRFVERPFLARRRRPAAPEPKAAAAA